MPNNEYHRSNEEIRKANTSDAVTDALDEIQAIITNNKEGSLRADDIMENWRSCAGGYLDLNNDLFRSLAK